MSGDGTDPWAILIIRSLYGNSTRNRTKIRIHYLYFGFYYLTHSLYKFPLYTSVCQTVMENLVSLI